MNSPSQVKFAITSEQEKSIREGASWHFDQYSSEPNGAYAFTLDAIRAILDIAEASSVKVWGQKGFSITVPGGYQNMLTVVFEDDILDQLFAQLGFRR